MRDYMLLILIWYGGIALAVYVLDVLSRRD